MNALVHTILIFGDSNTWGTNPDYCNRTTGRFDYPQRWTTHMGNSLGPNYHVVAEGLSGRTTALSDEIGSDRNGKMYLRNALMSHRPLHTVVIALGTNDLKSSYGIAENQVARNVRDLIVDIRHTNAIGEIDETSYNSNLTGEKSCIDYKSLKHSIPRILILAPARMRTTPISEAWGFLDMAKKSERLAELLAAMTSELKVLLITFLVILLILRLNLMYNLSYGIFFIFRLIF